MSKIFKKFTISLGKQTKSHKNKLLIVKDSKVQRKDGSEWARSIEEGLPKLGFRLGLEDWEVLNR